MKTIKLENSDKVAIVDDEDFVWLTRFKWFYMKLFQDANDQNYYACVKLGGSWRPMHVLVVPDDDNYEGCVRDHKNRDKMDNRKENLRWLTMSQNRANV